MARTTTLRAQHAAAEAIIDQIYTDIEHYRSDRDAFPLTLKLARLAGILRTHFAMEDEVLYPSMIESDQREAALTARVFRNELDCRAVRALRRALVEQRRDRRGAAPVRV